MAKYNVKHLDILERLKRWIYTIIPKETFNSPALKLFRSWLFQGTLYMERGELLFRASVEIVAFLLVAVAFRLFSGKIHILLPFLVSHTLLWLVTSHFWALEISRKHRLVANTPNRIVNYLEALERRVLRSRHIEGCVLFGSLARERFGTYSDLDIILVPAAGGSAFIAYSISLRERVLAFFQCIPIELYTYRQGFFRDIDEGESPLVLKDVGGRLTGGMPRFYFLRDYPFMEQSFFNPEGKDD
ncbi:nucleotidyltransferase domain-containing protein [Desulfomicrobium sp. ZS1]|uniref:nucleotidyltransferase domain-containing protein n=1 Tax=Desulfomicrobium sp. ZS1 TaxID=2952228 RepID=UPI0020B2CF3F|nr:nucleotidyltransferase domain-containing protein [Desulfomicrobium sp. ZS1]UTF49424.1 nucleotidyltransferase domain-containing protein [Desulfomicrobium sp. ZS1]